MTVWLSPSGHGVVGALAMERPAAAGLDGGSKVSMYPAISKTHRQHTRYQAAPTQPSCLRVSPTPTTHRFQWRCLFHIFSQLSAVKRGRRYHCLVLRPRALAWVWADSVLHDMMSSRLRDGQVGES